MASDEQLYFGGADCTLKVDTNILATVKGFEFTLRFDTNYARGMDSIFPVGSAKFNFRVEVKFKFLKFDPTLATWWLYDALDLEAGGSPRSIADTSRCQMFTIEGDCQPWNPDVDDVALHFVISNVYFDRIPFDLAENEWMAIDMSATGMDIVFTSPVAS